MKRFYVTTPIYYVNDSPHLGTAYTTIVADALARFHRMRGDDTRFLTGTDEHGQKIERAAKDKGVGEKAFVDEVSGRFRAVFPSGHGGTIDGGLEKAPLHVVPDDFIRTTEARHVTVVQDLWRKCRDRGFIYEGTYKGLYCVGCEAYYTEKELTQVDGAWTCPVHKTPVEKVTEPTYFFALSKLQDRLLALYEKHPEFVAPESRRNEVMSFVKGGLEDLSVSRTTFGWGIPVPDQPVDGKHKHVMYVWFDALTNYMSAVIGEPSLAKYWPADLHLIGKDILRFHAIFWPAFLLAAFDDEAMLPKKVFAHGWLTVNGHKMSKTLRNTVEPVALVEAFGVDVVRYYLMREVAFGQDGDFSHVQLVARYNAELADSLGNLLNRTLGLCTKLRAGTHALDAKPGRGPLEEKLEELARTSLAGMTSAFEEIAPHRGIESIWTLVRAANKYIDEAAPWSEAKKGDAAKARVDAILATALEAIDWIAWMVRPVMPEVSDKIFAQLGEPGVQESRGGDQLALRWKTEWSTERLAVGTPIFPKIDAEKQEAIFARLGVSLAAQEAPKAAEKAKEAPKKKEMAGPAAEITYDEFARMDLRVGVVKVASRVPKSDKLLQLMVDVGEPAPRQIIAGLGKSFAPEAMVGKQVVVVANLKPAKLMGLESRGMVLAASGEGGEADLALLGLGKDRTPGTRIK